MEMIFLGMMLEMTFLMAVVVMTFLRTPQTLERLLKLVETGRTDFSIFQRI